MHVLVVGGGGREHALARKIASSPLVTRVSVAPGNAGTANEAGCANVAIADTDGDALVAFARAENVGLVVVGPEAPLTAGVADAMRAAGILTVGPGADGAVLEASKAFAKDVMVAAGVPTARFARVTSEAEVDAFCDRFDGAALVVKADGLAAGKGVVVCDDVESARTEAKTMLRERRFGDASSVIVLEERLEGIETSYIVVTDGTRFVPFPTSQDHKRLRDGDEGPNTGGMGAFSPAPFVSDALIAQLHAEIIEPTLAEIRRRGIDYRGFLYAGVMLTPRGPMVLEFNARLGDPETQVLLTAIDGDIVPVLLECAKGGLTTTTFGTTSAAAVVVLAAEGYPDAPKKGAVIDGLLAAGELDDVVVFHAGTRLVDGNVTVNGGRVLGVTARGATPEAAIARAYRGVSCISWAGMHYRHDIGKALKA